MKKDESMKRVLAVYIDIHAWLLIHITILQKVLNIFMFMQGNCDYMCATSTLAPKCAALSQFNSIDICLQGGLLIPTSQIFLYCLFACLFWAGFFHFINQSVSSHSVTGYTNA